jgi:K+-sensing histidine kinase KdpD
MSKDSAWHLLPYPTLHADQTMVDGSLISTPKTCEKCSNHKCWANSPKRGAIGVCPYGLNYARLDDDVIIIGLAISDSPLPPTKQAKRRLRQERDNHVRIRDLERVIRSTVNMDAQLLHEFDSHRDRMVQEFLTSDDTLKAVTSALRSDISRSQNQSHDFLQLLKQIRGHIVAILEEKYPGQPPEEAAERLESEGAIFFATELMQAKLDATLFLTEPNRAFGEERPFGLHGLVTKYIRIYSFHARQKAVDLKASGESFGKVRYNSKAIGAVIHALLDNCVKYAPSGSRADILFDERAEKIQLQFISLGPKIEPDEAAKIFLPGYRAIAAVGTEASGLGFGLAAARTLSDALGLSLVVTQEPKAESGYPSCYRTTFSLSFDVYTSEQGKAGSKPSPTKRLKR